MSDLELPRDVALQTLSRYNVLALSGGGYRGLFAAAVLAKFEAKYKVKTRAKFGLLSGTSIGGIVATALAVDIPAQRIMDAFITHGESIFAKRPLPFRWFSGWTQAKYSSAALEKVIGEILGPHARTKLHALQQPLILPTVNVSLGGPCLLVSAGVDDRKAQDMTLAEAALATSAAPTYFPSRKVAQDDVVDGGLIANAPDLVALAAATRQQQMSIVHMLSIGTCGEPLVKPPGETIKSGKLGWLVKHRLIELTLTAQEQLAIETMRSFLNSRFLRIDAQPNGEELEHLGLDVATPKATMLLRSMADRAYTKGMADYGVRMAEFFH